MYRGRHFKRKKEIHQHRKISWPEILVGALVDLIVGIVLILLEGFIRWLANLILS